MLDIVSYLMLAPAVLMAARLKVAGSSVLIHHASHARLLPDAKRNAVAADLIGILTLNIPVADYRREHAAHHSLRTFATLMQAIDRWLTALAMEPASTKLVSACDRVANGADGKVDSIGRRE